VKRMGALLGTLALFSSCKASVVDTHPAVKGPVPEVPYIDFGGGQVRYPLGGARSLLGVRRRDAFRRMARFCGGAAHVKVRREFDRDDSETPYNAGELEEVVALHELNREPAARQMGERLPDLGGGFKAPEHELQGAAAHLGGQAGRLVGRVLDQHLDLRKGAAAELVRPAPCRAARAAPAAPYPGLGLVMGHEPEGETAIGQDKYSARPGPGRRRASSGVLTIRI